MIWIKALRLPFITASILPAILGTVIAPSIDWFLFILLLISVGTVHLGSNLANDYFDQKADSLNKNFTPVSGGSRVIQDKIIPAKQIITVSTILFTIGLIAGLAIIVRINSLVPIWFGLAGIALGFFYTSPPFRFSYHGLGEIAIAIAFGPLVVLGAYFVQTLTFSMLSFLVSIPAAILIFLIILINEFPDYDADKKAKKNTLVVIFGKKASIYLYRLLVILLYVLVGYYIFVKSFPLLTLLSFLTLPIGINILIKSKHYKDNKLMPVNNMTLLLQLAFLILLITGFVL